MTVKVLVTLPMRLWSLDVGAAVWFWPFAPDVGLIEVPCGSTTSIHAPGELVVGAGRVEGCWSCRRVAAGRTRRRSCRVRTTSRSDWSSGSRGGRSGAEVAVPVGG